MPGSKIITGADGHATVMPLPGIVLGLEPQTILEIVSLKLRRDGDESIRPMTRREASVRLERGAVVALVSQSQTRSRLTIATAAGNISAGSERTFRVSLTKSSLHLLSLRGAINFSASNSTSPIKVSSGYFLNLPGNGSPLAASETGSAMQTEVANLLRNQLRLRQLLQKAAAYR